LSDTKCSAGEATTYIRDVHLFPIIHAGDVRLPLRDEVIVIDVVGKETILCTGVTQTGDRIVQSQCDLSSVYR
jgi:hypothetical protein